MMVAGRDMHIMLFFSPIRLCFNSHHFLYYAEQTNPKMP